MLLPDPHLCSLGLNAGSNQIPGLLQLCRQLCPKPFLKLCSNPYLQYYAQPFS
jgi:hypothetical protein